MTQCRFACLALLRYLAVCYTVQLLHYNTTISRQCDVMWYLNDQSQVFNSHRGADINVEGTSTVLPIFLYLCSIFIAIMLHSKRY